MKEAVTKVIDTHSQENFHGAFQTLLERYNKCIAAEGDYFKGDLSFICVLSIIVPIRKSLETYLMIFIYINIYGVEGNYRVNFKTFLFFSLSSPIFEKKAQ